MAINREELDHLEDSLVHEADDEEVVPEGRGIYATPRFLGKVTVVAYLVMIGLVITAGLFYRGERIPIFLMPGSLFVASPFALVGLYLAFLGPREDVSVIKKRTTTGRWLTGLIAYLVLQVLTTAAWIGLSLAFKMG